MENIPPPPISKKRERHTWIVLYSTIIYTCCFIIFVHRIEASLMSVCLQLYVTIWNYASKCKPCDCTAMKQVQQQNERLWPDTDITTELHFLFSSVCGLGIHCSKRAGDVIGIATSETGIHTQRVLDRTSGGSYSVPRDDRARPTMCEWDQAIVS